MPEKSSHKFRPSIDRLDRSSAGNSAEYAELQVCSNFSFLRGASHVEELIATAAALNYRAIAITDINSFAGIVRAHQAAKQYEIQLIVGTKLCIQDDDYASELLCYPINLRGYQDLSRLLSLGKQRANRGECIVHLEEVLAALSHCVVVIVPPFQFKPHDCSGNLALQKLKHLAQKVRAALPTTLQCSIALTRNYESVTSNYILAICNIAQALNISLIATNDVYYHLTTRKPLQDILTCIRNGCTIEQAGYRLFRNSERTLKPPDEMLRLFRDMPNAVRRSVEIAEMLSSFSLEQLRYEYPDSVVPSHTSALAYLRELTERGARERYPQALPKKITDLIEQELALISQLKYEKYFLTCYDIVRFARSRGILCQGRGAAANSAVCFCLGITAVDPDKIDLLFARFISQERNEPPDIDIDFEHERREEVIQYIYDKYGREHAALTAEVVTYRHRSAMREVAKAFGLSLDIVDRLAKSIHRWTKCKLSAEELNELGLNPDDRTIKNTINLALELYGFPRHLSQHVGGFVISQQPLCEIVPILNATMPNRTIIEWDKDDIEILGMLKIDVLALGMLTCIRKALMFVNQRRLHAHDTALHLHTIPAEDPEVYKMICRADTVGVFQIESRAQMSMLPRLKPKCFYDLVIEVAIVRPGPIHGNMVHPYLRRRNGIERYECPDQEVAAILGKTLGVPIFQEQAMRLAITLAQFSPGEAELLRRAMGAWKRNKSLIATFKERVVSGMVSKGYSVQFAETCMDQIKGFSEYGFPESHAASFALLAYASSWLKCHYPAEFATALINSMPMGFYSTSQIIQDIERHGVQVLPIDVNYSAWDCSLEAAHADSFLTPTTLKSALPKIRLGMRLVHGLRQVDAEIISNGVNSYGNFYRIHDLWQRLKVRRAALQALAHADAFGSLALSRRDALWEVKALPADVRPLDTATPAIEGSKLLPSQSQQSSMFADFAATGFSLKAHPMQFIRAKLNARGAASAETLRCAVLKRQSVLAAGIATIRQRPGTAKGVVFVTLEDETGNVNLIIRPDIFESYRNLVISTSCILAHGVLDRVGEVVYINVSSLESLDAEVFPRKDPVELPSRSYSY